MATFLFSQVKGTSFSFKAKTDVLHFDYGSAADLDMTMAGTTLTLRIGTDWVSLLNPGQIGSFATTNITFADGSLLLIGDDTTATTRDGAANVLTGGAGNDRLIGLAGNDTLDGRDGSDTYVVTGTNDGTDLYRDTGTTGTDRIIAGSDGALIRLGSAFSNALTGIEAISGQGFAGVNVMGTAGADALNFTGVNLTGIALIDAQGGADNVTGSAADDVIQGGAGADTLDGGAGRDTAVYAGNRATYSITTANGVVTVRDLDAIANGNDGTDTLRNIESLRFLNGTVSLTAPTAAADSANLAANSAAAAINVLGNDTDLDTGDTMRVISVQAAGLQGSAWAAADGSGVMYAPGAAFHSLRAGATAIETFAYTMADSTGAQASATVTLTITGVNDGPTAVDDNAAAGEGAPIFINVLGNDTDPDFGDTLRIVAIDRTGTVGTTAFGSSGGVPQIYYQASQTLRAGETATDQFSYTIEDASGARSTASVNVVVTGANDAPTARNDNVSTAANAGPITIDALANDTDIDAGDSKAVLTVDGSGRPASFYLVQSGEVTFPVLIPAVAPIKGAIAVAPNGQGIVYSPGDAFASLGAGQSAVETIIYKMVDGAGAQSEALANVTVTGVNDAPVATADAIALAKNAAPVTINVLGNDSDVDQGDTKTIIALDTTGTTGGVTIAADGRSVLYTVGTAFQSLSDGATATDTFTYRIVDSAGAESTALVTVTVMGVNTAPVAAADAANATENGAPVSIAVLANDTDVDAGDTQTVISVDNTGTHGSASVTPGGGSVTYAVGGAFQNLRAGATATDTFTYTMADRNGATSSATVNVTVTGVNDAPIAIADGALAPEDGGSVFVNVLGNDVDVDAGDTLSVVALTTTGLKGSAFIAAGGSGVDYTPYQSLRAGQTGTDTFTYTVRDGAGVQSTATVTMTVTGGNDAPIANADAGSVTEDAGATTFQVLANDTDADLGDTKRVVAIETNGLNGSATISANGTGIVYAPGNAYQQLLTGQSASEIVWYTMADAAGETSRSSLTVTVNGITDNTKANADTISANEDSGPVLINVLTNDFNDSAPGGTLNVTAIDGSGRYSSPRLGFFDGAPQLIGFDPGFPRLLGQAAIAADGKIEYTPLQSLNAGETGVDKFLYTVTGSDGTTSSTVVSVNVTGVNDAPTAVADVADTSANGGALLIDVLANDIDPDTRVDPPAPVVPPSDFSFLIYDPTPADVADTKTVIAVDGAGLQGAVGLAEGGSGVIYTPGGTLLNLQFGQSAVETFSYTMRDAAGVQSSANVSVTVTGVNHAPTAADDSVSVFENGAPVSIAVLENDSDADRVAGDSLAIVALDAAGLQGTAEIVGSTIEYSVGNAFQNLRAGVTATESFGYIVSDNEGAVTTANVSVTVTGVNDAPTATPDSLAVSEDSGTVTINVLANDTDVDAGDTKAITSINTTGLQGSAAIAADGQSISYTVASGFQSLLTGQSANESFGYTMRDGAGVTSTATVSLTIIGANEPVVIVNPPAPPPGAIVGGSGDDIMTGTTGADIIYGQAGKDDISAGDGNDTLFGGADNDTLNGGAGNDILNGGLGRDDMTGGTGADTFRFYLASESNDPTKPDRIRDFSSAEGDKIDLSLIDANTVLGGNNDFILSSAFSGIAGQLVVTFDPVTGSLVQGDVNGDGAADFVFSLDRVAVSGADFLL